MAYFMRTFNQCTFIGHTGSDPKLLTASNGKSFTRFRLGVSNLGKEEQNDTLWLTVLIWREDLAKTVSDLVRTGSLVLASGRLSVRLYTDKNSAERTNIELIAEKVELLEKGKQEQPTAQTQAADTKSIQDPNTLAA